MDTLNPTYYWYDANGNMITRVIGGSTYNLSYDTETHLTGVSGAASATFAYDGDGKRVKGTVEGTTTVYIGNYFEWTGSTSTMKRYYYAGGTRIAMWEGSTLSWLLSDHLDSTSITANASGARTGEVRYRPWGEDRYTWGTTPTTFRYTGQRQEAALGGADGLYYYGARWYDSALGRFASPDTIIPEASQGIQAWDRYAGMNNNPVRYNDPSGHCIGPASALLAYCVLAGIAIYAEIRTVMLEADNASPYQPEPTGYPSRTPLISQTPTITPIPSQAQIPSQTTIPEPMTLVDAVNTMESVGDDFLMQNLSGAPNWSGLAASNPMTAPFAEPLQVLEAYWTTQRLLGIDISDSIEDILTPAPTSSDPSPTPSATIPAPTPNQVYTTNTPTPYMLTPTPKPPAVTRKPY